MTNSHWFEIVLDINATSSLDAIIGILFYSTILIQNIKNKGKINRGSKNPCLLSSLD